MNYIKYIILSKYRIIKRIMERIISEIFSIIAYVIENQ